MKRIAILAGFLALGAAAPASGQARVSVDVVLGHPRPHLRGVVVVGRRPPHRFHRGHGVVVIVDARRPRVHRGGLVVVRERSHRRSRHWHRGRWCHHDD